MRVLARLVRKHWRKALPNVACGRPVENNTVDDGVVQQVVIHNFVNGAVQNTHTHRLSLSWVFIYTFMGKLCAPKRVAKGVMYVMLCSVSMRGWWKWNGMHGDAASHSFERMFSVTRARASHPLLLFVVWIISWISLYRCYLMKHVSITATRVRDYLSKTQPKLLTTAHRK